MDPSPPDPFPDAKRGKFFPRGLTLPGGVGLRLAKTSSKIKDKVGARLKQHGSSTKRAPREDGLFEDASAATDGAGKGQPLPIDPHQFEASADDEQEGPVLAVELDELVRQRDGAEVAQADTAVLTARTTAPCPGQSRSTPPLGGAVEPAETTGNPSATASLGMSAPGKQEAPTALLASGEAESKQSALQVEQSDAAAGASLAASHVMARRADRAEDTDLYAETRAPLSATSDAPAPPAGDIRWSQNVVSLVTIRPAEEDERDLAQVPRRSLESVPPSSATTRWTPSSRAADVVARLAVWILHVIAALRALCARSIGSRGHGRRWPPPTAEVSPDTAPNVSHPGDEKVNGDEDREPPEGEQVRDELSIPTMSENSFAGPPSGDSPVYEQFIASLEWPLKGDRTATAAAESAALQDGEPSDANFGKGEGAYGRKSSDVKPKRKISAQLRRLRSKLSSAESADGDNGWARVPPRGDPSGGKSATHAAQYSSPIAAAATASVPTAPVSFPEPTAADRKDVVKSANQKVEDQDGGSASEADAAPKDRSQKSVGTGISVSNAESQTSSLPSRGAGPDALGSAGSLARDGYSECTTTQRDGRARHERKHFDEAVARHESRGKAAGGNGPVGDVLRDVKNAPKALLKSLGGLRRGAAEDTRF
jgi:hypothetical protein